MVCVERLDRAGGKLAEHRAAGFSWETGPSLLTLPQVFRDLVAVAGADLDDLVSLRRLDPICRYRFADGTSWDHRADPAAAVAAVEGLSPGSGADWEAFLARARTVWEVSERTFFAGPMASPLRLLQRMRSPRDLVAVDSLRTLADRAERTFADPRLRQHVGRYATYSGSSPHEAPATLACIGAIEQDLGAWYVDGGLGRLAEALADLARSVGVDLRLSTSAEALVHDGQRVRGVRVEPTASAGSGDEAEVLHADAVVSDVDALHLYRDLLPDKPLRTRVAAWRTERTERSSSGFVLLLGVEGRTEDAAGGLAHHNISFSADHEAEFDALFATGTPIADPTVYVCASSVTDPTTAPEGHESWFVLVNAPAGSGAMDGYGDHLLEVMARRGWDLSGRIVHREQITPADIEDRYRTPGGSIYGTSSNGALAAFLRPGNAGPLDGLFLCGGSSHPGGGLPLVAISGRIAADLAVDHLG